MDHLSFGLSGHVRLLDAAGHVLLDDHNLIVDASVEAALQALMGRDQIGAIVLADSGGRAATPGMRSVYNPVVRVPIGTAVGASPSVAKDAKGLKALGTWYGTFTNTTLDAISYDLIGLVTQNDRLFAAKSFPAILLPAGESVAFEWSIHIDRR